MLLTAIIMLYIGSFDNIPAYDPSATSCTDVTTNTLVTSTQAIKTSTTLETSTGIISWTPTPVQTITSQVQSPSLTSSGRPANGAQDYFTIGMIIAVSAAAGILIIIIAAVIICCVMFRSVHIHA